MAGSGLPVAQQVFRPWLHKLWNLHWHIAWANARKIAVQQRHSDVCAKSRVQTKPQLTGTKTATHWDKWRLYFKALQAANRPRRPAVDLTASRAKQWFCGHMFMHMFMHRCWKFEGKILKYVCWRTSLLHGFTSSTLLQPSIAMHSWHSSQLPWFTRDRPLSICWSTPSNLWQRPPQELGHKTIQNCVVTPWPTSEIIQDTSTTKLET